MSATPRPRRRRRLARWAAVAILIATLYLTRGWTLPAWGRWLDASEPPRAADYALVLTGGEETRPFVAAGLYKRGFVKEVLVPRMRLIPDAADGIAPPESDQIREVLVRRGVPADRITPLSGEVNSTSDEAAALARFLADHPDATVAIVTNDFHTRRARSIFRRALGPRAGQVYFVAAPTDRFSAADWWRTELGFETYLSETAKAAYYAVRD